MSADVTSLARRSPRPQLRSESRRANLLTALENELRHHTLAEVSISAVTRGAGLGRSAFYFYFPSKHAAVADLLSGVYDELSDLASDLLLGRGVPRDNFADALRHTVAIWRQHRLLFCAMLDAVAADPGVAKVWTRWIAMFEDVVVRVADEQAWPIVIPSEIGLRRTVTGLLAMNTSVLEAHVRSDGDHAEARLVGDLLVHVWTSALFGQEHS
ncbi:TetR/AcrR family transcriptional regulator [Aeromicrobium alkaliterrae]|uniref:HTH-type transcriptional regulator EthR n=1 Tax=Aeromicrobium alkaliterrae TaxID=302168 RepID=A0ABN2K7L7_9ACTN